MRLTEQGTQVARQMALSGDEDTFATRARSRHPPTDRVSTTKPHLGFAPSCVQPSAPRVGQWIPLAGTVRHQGLHSCGNEPQGRDRVGGMYSWAVCVVEADPG
jgi:hypothetical protein